MYMYENIMVMVIKWLREHAHYLSTVREILRGIPLGRPARPHTCYL